MMSAGEIINIVLIAILVLTTIYYAIQNRGMRDEMRKERELSMGTIRRSIKPNLIVNRLLVNLGLTGSKFKEEQQFCELYYSPIIELEIVNVGLGDAIDVNIEATAVFEWKLPTNIPPIRRLFHFSNKPDSNIYPIWIHTIPSRSGTQEVRLHIATSESVSDILPGEIECKLSYSNILGERIEHEPIRVDSSRCQDKISKVAQEYRLVLAEEVIEVKFDSSGHRLRKSKKN